MSAFGRYHPSVAVFYFMAVIVAAMFCGNPIISGIALISGVCFSLVLEKKRGFGIYLLMFLLIALTNPLFSHNGVTPLFFLNGNPITYEAIMCGIGNGIMIVSVIIWFGCFGHIMTSDKIIHVFGSAIPKIALIISMVIRFVPMVLRQSKKISRGQASLGIKPIGIFEKTRFYLKVFTAVTAWAFENAAETANAMKARGYGAAKRSRFTVFKFTFRDWVLCLLVLVLAVVIYAGIFTCNINFTYYPAVDNIPDSITSTVVYFAYGFLAFIPFIIEVKEALTWRFCVGKI